MKTMQQQLDRVGDALDTTAKMVQTNEEHTNKMVRIDMKVMFKTVPTEVETTNEKVLTAIETTIDKPPEHRGKEQDNKDKEIIQSAITPSAKQVGSDVLQPT